ncbi:MAG TPA: hypothetical protein DCF48_02015 [Rikenellaceae bacterium]|nr:hypothetical protein [Rikenellaceae bacterium]
MKRMNYFGALAVAAIAFAGCNKVEQSIENKVEKSGIPFEFVASGVETKTTSDGYNATLWATGDEVNLFHAVAGSTTYVSDGAFEATAGGASVTFSGTLASALTEDNYDWYAIYPQNDNITTPANTGTKGYVTVGSSATGNQVQDGNDSKLHLAGTRIPVAGKVLGVAKDTKPSIAMQHLVSVICVHLVNGTSSPITVSEISFTGTEDIVGTYFIDFVSSPVVYTPSGAKYVSSTATLSVTGGAAINPGNDAVFYMAVKPFTAPKGGTISLSVTADNGAQVRQKVLAADAVFLPGSLNSLIFTYDKSASSVAEPTSKTGWYRVESATWLTAGDRVAIVNNNGTKAMSKVQKTNNRDGVDVTINAEDDYKKLTINDNVQQFILENGTEAGSFAFWCDNGDEASKYIFAASSSNNHLKSSFTLDANASFTPSIIEGLGSLTAQGLNSHKVLRYNNLFSCYTSASYDNISLYKYYGTWPDAMVCANPTISQSVNTVTIECTSPGVTIYYTTDGTNPDKTNNEQKYTHAFNITQPVTVKAIAVRSHYTDSEIVSKDCSVNVATPVITFTGTSFSISCATEGATIYYKTSTVGLSDIVEPLESPVTYSAAVPYFQTTYVKAYAVKSGYTTSATVSQTCTYSAGSPNTYSCTFTNKSWATNAASDFSWTSGKDGAGFSNNGIQVTTNSTGANATTKKVFGAVSQVIVTYNTNASKGAGTLELKIGSNNTHTENWAYSTGTGTSANYTCTFSLSSAESGAIKLTANTTQNSIYIVSVSVKAMTMSNPE